VPNFHPCGAEVHRYRNIATRKTRKTEQVKHAHGSELNCGCFVTAVGISRFQSAMDTNETQNDEFRAFFTVLELLLMLNMGHCSFE
jgi:transcriptional regulator of met regulon